MATPESKIKRHVKGILAQYEPELWCNWPVPTGFGEPTLDCVGCFKGRFFAIETKKPKMMPTPRQKATMREMKLAGAKVFLIDGDKWPYIWLERWLQAVKLSRR